MTEVADAAVEGPTVVGRDNAGARASHGSPLVELQCFGAFEVRCGERELSAAGGTGVHSRSWEILAFIAAQPSPVVSSEKLIAALWPESRSHQAASALGAALSRLRGLVSHQLPHLESDIVLRGDGTCRLDAACFRSDVHRFVERCHAARRLPPEGAIGALEEARALYGGNLLQNEPYVWVHEREDDGLTLQERYRETFQQITNELAGLYRKVGQPAKAVPLYKSLLKAEPTLEDVARALYRCYQELGDRVSLKREHRHLLRALESAYIDPDDPDADPSLAEPEPETSAVYQTALAALGTQDGVASSRERAPARAA